ncbi:hypothetical protein RHECNPAF_17000111 [Rhizobium etli CNPAF512]|nr:hypothetical protein RHECNPAF_17000111 [Rhizobium etli CNPAF512]
MFFISCHGCQKYTVLGNCEMLPSRAVQKIRNHESISC